MSIQLLFISHSSSLFTCHVFSSSLQVPNPRSSHGFVCFQIKNTYRTNYVDTMMIAPTKNPLSQKTNIFRTKNLSSDTIHPSIHPFQIQGLAYVTCSAVPSWRPVRRCRGRSPRRRPTGRSPVGRGVSSWDICRRKNRNVASPWKSSWSHLAKRLFVEAPSHRFFGGVGYGWGCLLLA